MSQQPAKPPKQFVAARGAEQLSPEEKIARAAEAQRLLEHPLLKEAFANLQLDYFEAFTACDPANIHGRDNIFHSARVLTQVQQHLRIVMSDGKVAQAQIDKVLARTGKSA